MITVVFSTYNGADTLPPMLKSLARCAQPEGGWQLIAVNNASSDKSNEVLKSYNDVLPLTILYEKRRGKNFALNTAVESAKGDLIIFTDDDVVVDVDWLVTYRKYSDMKPEISIFGGHIAPCWEEDPPRWILDLVSLPWAFALTPITLEEGEITAGFIFGPNMAIRKSVFDKGYRYDTKIGPNGNKSYIMGSETSFTRMLAQNGFKCYHLPSAKVCHIIRKFQLNRSWILSRAVRAGRGDFIAKSSKYSEHKLLNNVPKSLIRQYFRHKVSLIRSYIVFNKRDIFNEQWNCNFIKGKILESHRHFSENKIAQ